jgi:hypothetical protein
MMGKKSMMLTLLILVFLTAGSLLYAEAVLSEESREPSTDTPQAGTVTIHPDHPSGKVVEMIEGSLWACVAGGHDCWP